MAETRQIPIVQMQRMSLLPKLACLHAAKIYHTVAQRHEINFKDKVLFWAIQIQDSVLWWKSTSLFKVTNMVERKHFRLAKNLKRICRLSSIKCVCYTISLTKNLVKILWTPLAKIFGRMASHWIPKPC